MIFPEIIAVQVSRPEQLYAMESKLQSQREEILRLKDRAQELESKYGFESMLNNELLDIVREHNLTVRPGLLRK